MINPPATLSATTLEPPQHLTTSSDVAFADVMRTAQHSASQDDVRQAAEDLVANAFIAPILRQVRETSDAAPPFQQTPAEKQFGQMLDAETARQIVHKSRLPIVDRLINTFERLRGQHNSINRSEGVTA